MQRKKWIDNLRGFCMLAILLDHTELYYAGSNIIDYNFYVVNALVIFFFLSGYLIYKPSCFDIRHKLYSIFRSLLIPYFIFTTLIAAPKALIHENDINIHEIIINIITGQASWFVATLCISELIFAFIIWIFRGKNWELLTCSILGFTISIYLSTGNQPYFWQLDNAMQALLFLCFGYLFHKYEVFFNSFNKISYITFLFFITIGIKIYEYYQHVDLLIWNIHITNYFLFLIDIFISTLFMVQIFKRIPSNKYISWTGRHSIVYYFLCGGVPLIISKLLQKLGISYDGNYIYILCAFISVYIVTSFITYIIYKYIPFIVGKNNEKNSK